MSTLVIEHLEASELPQDWAARLRAKPGQTVTVRIETESEQPAPTATSPFVTDDPAFGIWRDRQDTADVDSYARGLRAPRYARDGSRKKS
jgi:hypothetical protein